MRVSDIVAFIDREIAQLTLARALLAGGRGVLSKKGPGQRVHGAVGKVALKRRVLSPEGRKRIAEAQKKRWAAQKKAAASA